MKKTHMNLLKRLECLLLACLLTMSMFPVLALRAEASTDKVIPEMSKFFETEYTQAKMTEYSRLLTCTYDKCEGTAPLDAFLDLLMEERYQLVLASISEPYPDSYSTATVQDYFFNYIGESSAIKWIKLKNGTKYHVRVSLYTYEEKDYSAIVYYSHPNFLHRDAGITYREIRQQKAVTVTEPPVQETKPKAKETEPKETIKETEPFFFEGAPDLREYFGNPLQTKREEGRTEYYFEFSQYPAAGMRSFEKYLESIGARESFYEAYETGNILVEYGGKDGILVSMYWLDSNNSLGVILYDADWENVGEEPELTVTNLKNRQTVKVLEDAAFSIKKRKKAYLKCTFNEGKDRDFYWDILSGEDVISMNESKNKCQIKGKKTGTAEIEMTCFYENEDGKDTSITYYYTIIVK